jgi:hypothetical protein
LEDPTYFYSIGYSLTASTPVEYICFWRSGLGASMIDQVSKHLSSCPDTCKSVLSKDCSMVEGFLGANIPLALCPLKGNRERIVRKEYARLLGSSEYSDYVIPHTIVQIVLPDLKGKFAGQDGFDERFRRFVPKELSLSLAN